jgi:hypothetical protein
MTDADPEHARQADPHTGDVHGSAGHPDAHGGGHGAHGAAGAEPLGPIDVGLWAYSVIGAGLGLLVAVVLYLAAS